MFFLFPIGNILFLFLWWFLIAVEVFSRAFQSSQINMVPTCGRSSVKFYFLTFKLSCAKTNFHSLFFFLILRNMLHILHSISYTEGTIRLPPPDIPWVLSHSNPHPLTFHLPFSHLSSTFVSHLQPSSTQPLIICHLTNILFKLRWYRVCHNSCISYVLCFGFVCFYVLFENPAGWPIIERLILPIKTWNVWI